MTDLKKRQVHAIGFNNMGSFRPRHNVEGQTVSWHQASNWQQDNKHILTGYRSAKADYVEALTSLTFLHNETCNVYIHLIGALLLPFFAINFMGLFPEPRFIDVARTDYIVCGLFFFCAECCLLFSALYHLLQFHSHGVEQFWHRMDLLGIVLVTVGTFVPGIYYVFTCDSRLQNLHWTIITITGTTTAALIYVPVFRTLRWRAVRVSAYFALGASSLIPLLHGVHLYGLEYMLRYSGMNWYILELALYCFGVVMYGSRTPERFAPGRFDIWGSSHQIFHVAILCAIYVHAIALTQAFVACHTLDLCKIKEFYQAG